MNTRLKAFTALNLTLLAGASLAQDNALPFCDAVLASGIPSESAGNGCGVELPPPTLLVSGPNVRHVANLQATSSHSYFHFVIDPRSLQLASQDAAWFRIVEVDTESGRQRLAFEVARSGPDATPKYRLVIEARYGDGFTPSDYADIDAGGSCLRVDGTWVTGVVMPAAIHHPRSRLLLALRPSEHCNAPDEDIDGGQTLVLQPLDAPVHLRIGQLGHVGIPDSSWQGEAWVNLFHPLPWY